MQISNYSTTAFTGWKRITIDTPPPAKAGKWPSGARYVVGHAFGDGCHVVDVWCELAPGESVTLDIAEATMVPDVPPEFPPDILGWFGGGIMLNGEPLSLVNIERDGAAFALHMRKRTGKMLNVDLWFRWYPGQAWAEGEVAVTASNPEVPDMSEDASGLKLTFGDALVLHQGTGIKEELTDHVLVDGQSRMFPVLLVWQRHLTSPEAWASVGAVGYFGIGGSGIENLWGGETGVPYFPQDFSARQWANERLGEASSRLHNWKPPVCGPNLASSNTGAQEDQLFHPGGEALLPDGAGAEWVRYLSALKLHGERPCNHLNYSGRVVDPDDYGRLIMWDGRPFGQLSDTMLGKPRALTPQEARGRWGPDTQHFLARTLGSAAKLTGSPACQRLMESLAIVYLTQRTTNPSWASSGTFSAREWGYEGLFAVQCDDVLRDRELAARVVENFKTRVQRFLVPEMAEKDYITIFKNDNRLGPGEWTIAWQESLATYGVDLACERFGVPEGRQVMLELAKRLMANAWHKSGENWLSLAQYPIDGQELGDPVGSFNFFGLPLCVATVLRHEPQDPKANEIWDYLIREEGYKWVPTGVR